ncbi:MAG: hypothetical protein M1608_16090 [Candidatus Omnitrophica bacterium]|nr:hypothetical protein [Candidatus Omnitrophota bacterium]
MLAFVTDGLAQFGLRTLQELRLAETHTFLYLAFWYFTGLAVGTLIYGFTPRRPPIRAREMVMGLILSLCSAGCWYSMSSAFVHHVPAYLGLPVSICGGISLVTLAGVLVFKERLSLYGYLGILFSITGIALFVSP